MLAEPLHRVSSEYELIIHTAIAAETSRHSVSPSILECQISRYRVLFIFRPNRSFIRLSSVMDQTISRKGFIEAFSKAKRPYDTARRRPGKLWNVSQRVIHMDTRQIRISTDLRKHKSPEGYTKYRVSRALADLASRAKDHHEENAPELGKARATPSLD
jgi:hypothetical protein